MIYKTGRNTDNTTTRRNRTNGQTMIYKTRRNTNNTTTRRNRTNGQTMIYKTRRTTDNTTTRIKTRTNNDIQNSEKHRQYND